MKLVRAVGVVVLATVAFTACDEDTTGVEVSDLSGFWNSTQFEYSDVTGEAPGFGVDGTVTLDVETDGSFTGTLTMPRVTVDPETGETVTVDIGGTLSIGEDAETLSIDFDAETEAIPAQPLMDIDDAPFSLGGGVLSFTHETTFDFPGELEVEVLGAERGEVAVRVSARFER
ncbi:MAG: hypothetical protein ACOCVZ_09420 [Gemmatimonadota bacterium]